MWTISLPSSVPVSAKKKFSLNINQYRNAHHHTLNKAKVVFDELVQPLLKILPKMEQVKLSYMLYQGTNGKIDTANVCSIVDKFFSDSLVSAGKIPDDNSDIVLSVKFRYGGVDKHNPRVDVIVEPIGSWSNPEEKDDDMQITIVQTEIETAIINYLRSIMDIKEGMEITMDLAATRGPEGFKATIDITDPKNGSGASSVVAARAPAAKTTVAVTATKPAVVVAKAEPQDDATQEERVTEYLAEQETEVQPNEPTEEVATEEETAPRVSLFGGLKKPVNG